MRRNQGLGQSCGKALMRKQENQAAAVYAP